MTNLTKRWKRLHVVSSERACRIAAEIKNSLSVQEEGQVICDIDVSFDATYMTRGHMSKVGVPTVTGCETGKVLDTDSRSKFASPVITWTHKTQPLRGIATGRQNRRVSAH